MHESARVRFLVGPAGSGKTFRCLAEIRAALARAPDGDPLVFLAPKQATFQIERQLLSDPKLPGYTRLEILSFERLADFIAQKCGVSAPAELNEQGRLMVLRALLGQHRNRLQIFRSTARLPGLAQQLGSVLREFKQCRIGPDRLRELAARDNLPRELAAKLSDLALMLNSYEEWLSEHSLRDSESHLDFAAAILTAANRTAESKRPFTIEGIWLDGFAEMTPQELSLLAAVIPYCRRATIAFCLEDVPQDDLPWLSTWSLIAQTFRRCFQQIAALPDVRVAIDTLPRSAESGRFVSSPALQHLETFWSRPRPFDPISTSGAADRAPIRMVTCQNPEAEAIFAAREVIRSVRNGARFRDIAVLVRSLDRYYDLLRRVFARYEIPCFIDRREPITHHPLAELTRFALRTICFGWQQEDWFAALKTGLVSAEEGEIDLLENEARARGWEGGVWSGPLPGGNPSLESLRSRLVSPFVRLAAELLGPVSNANSTATPSGADAPGSINAYQPTARQLAAALERFWNHLDIPRQLEQWSAAAAPIPSPNSVHLTVWEQMQDWRKNFALGFQDERLPLREWLPILEAGLAGLSVGVIPPALDQVLIGAVDRSRNPDLKLAIVLGLNESVFPAPPPKPILLTEVERAELQNHRVFLGASAKQRLGHERYLAYIACTRPRERLVLTYAATDTSGTPLNPSPILAHLRQLFPRVQPELVTHEPDWTEAEHPHELIPHLLRYRATGNAAAPLAALEELDAVQPILRQWSQLARARSQTQLSPASVESLFGHVLRTSVSALEQFGACPFNFFVQSGLRAKERDEFELDHREKGSFQHAVLQEFHRELDAERKRWRDITPDEARERVARIGERLRIAFKEGIFDAAHDRRFSAQLLIEQLQQFAATLVGWMAQYTFDPAAVELGFGVTDGSLPGWEIDLPNGCRLMLRGWIDRVDIGPEIADAPGTRLVSVIDYKSNARRLDPVKLQHGLELQLLSYLGVLRSLPNAQELFKATQLEPAGVFYVSLRGQARSCKSRAESIKRTDGRVDSPHQHSGRFNATYLKQFDAAGADRGDQFKYRLKKDGGLHATGNDALGSAEFHQLLESIEEHLRNFGRRIYEGEASVAPFRKGNETACDYCICRPICRFDPWTNPFRVLRAKSDVTH